MNWSASKIPELTPLKLVLLKSSEGDTLVSLTHEIILAFGDDLSTTEGIPEIYAGEEEEAAARDLAGLPDGLGWPGWKVMLPWLRTRV